MNRIDTSGIEVGVEFHRSRNAAKGKIDSDLGAIAVDLPNSPPADLRRRKATDIEQPRL